MPYANCVIAATAPISVCAQAQVHHGAHHAARGQAGQAFSMVHSMRMVVQDARGAAQLQSHARCARQRRARPSWLLQPLSSWPPTARNVRAHPQRGRHGRTRGVAMRWLVLLSEKVDVKRSLKKRGQTHREIHDLLNFILGPRDRRMLALTRAQCAS